ncbi:MAG: heme-copper oxidase subunit III [Deltaproteobacteria bacterium]|nr:heme-copper oxidase subunit III [Deltaproteobacteria bacterium]
MTSQAVTTLPGSIGAARGESGAWPQVSALGAASDRRPRIANAVLGMLIFLGAEAMFFAGLISAFLVLRAGSLAWPPPDQPRLPVGITFANTLVLLLSADTMRRALAAIRAGHLQALPRWLGATAMLGTAFLLVQGSEWLRLLGYGLRASSGPYGATFYTLIGCHGLHLLGGLIVLLAVLRSARRQRYTAHAHGAVEAARLYWYFVVGIWPILYGLVYLS